MKDNVSLDGWYVTIEKEINKTQTLSINVNEIRRFSLRKDQKEILINKMWKLRNNEK